MAKKPPTIRWTPVASKRYRALLEQLGKEEEARLAAQGFVGTDRWKTAVGKRVGVTGEFVARVLEPGGKQGGLSSIEKAAQALRIRGEFFLDPTLVNPNYRDFVGPLAITSDPPGLTALLTSRAASVSDDEIIRLRTFAAHPLALTLTRADWFDLLTHLQDRAEHATEWTEDDFADWLHRRAGRPDARHFLPKRS
jgi:hypothetical protein